MRCLLLSSQHSLLFLHRNSSSSFIHLSSSSLGFRCIPIPINVPFLFGLHHPFHLVCMLSTCRFLTASTFYLRHLYDLFSPMPPRPPSFLLNSLISSRIHSTANDKQKVLVLCGRRVADQFRGDSSDNYHVEPWYLFIKMVSVAIIDNEHIIKAPKAKGHPLVTTPSSLDGGNNTYKLVSLFRLKYLISCCWISVGPHARRYTYSHTHPQART